MAGRRRAQAVASRLGVALREARLAAGLTQRQAAETAGLSQPRFGDLERGIGAGASLESWAIAAASVDERLAAFLERAPGANRPRDIEVGGAWRGLDAKVLALPHRLRPRPTEVGALFVLRRTRRNQALVRELAPLFRARFRAGGDGWIRALGMPGVSAPNGTGFLWSLADGRLTAPRLRR